MTTTPIATYKAFDVVVVPFPFVDSAQVKKRPALVLSSDLVFNRKINHSVMAMITSTKNTIWPCDMLIKDLAPTGLSATSLVRMKLFTLDHRFVVAKIGHLAKSDQAQIATTLARLFPISAKNVTE